MGPGLEKAVRFGIDYGRQQNVIFSWLCVTNTGAERVNAAALRLLGIDNTDENLLFGDPKVNAGRINITTGVMLRLTRNLDKGRGFVNGAIGEVYAELGHHAFILKLSTGNLVLVHPISVGGRHVFPCAYGYATTIRKAQGASLAAGCLYFDHCYPSERGYGYVGASRFRSKDGIFYYGTLRRSDWLPRQTSEDQQVVRSMDSESEDSRDAANESEYGSSDGSSEDREDSIDGELGRLARGTGYVEDGLGTPSDSESEDGGLRALAMTEWGDCRKRPGLDELAALDGLLPQASLQ